MLNTKYAKDCISTTTTYINTLNPWCLQAWDSCSLEAHRSNSSVWRSGRPGQTMFPSSKWHTHSFNPIFIFFIHSVTISWKFLSNKCDNWHFQNPQCTKFLFPFEIVCKQDNLGLSHLWVKFMTSFVQFFQPCKDFQTTIQST